MACMSALVTPCDHLTAPRSAAGRAGAGAGAGGGTPARCISAPRGWGAGDCIIHHTLHMCRTLYCTVLYCTVLYSPHAAYVQDTAVDSWLVAGSYCGELFRILDIY